MKHRCHTKGGKVALLPESVHKIYHKTNPCGSDFKSEVDRDRFETWSRNVLKTLAVDLIQGRIKHKMVTDEVRKHFTGGHDPDDDPKGKKSSKFRRAARFAQAYQYEHKPGVFQGLLAPSTPRPGGIEIMALEWDSNMPRVTQMSLEKDGKHLMIVFGRTKYYLPTNNISFTELKCLLDSTFKFQVQRLCVDIAASGEYYTLSFDGGVHTSSTLSATMEEADFLLGAFAFGRDASTGVLFQPKPGQLEGYKNPIPETARLLHSDKEYATTRCRYRDVFLHPTLVCKDSFAVPQTSLMDWWPQLDFPKTVFKLTCRLTLVDLSDRQSYYDVPEILDIDPEAMILLRPYKPLIEAFKTHGAKWIASEPLLCKVETAARVFQVLSMARSSGFALPSVLLSLHATTPTHYKRVNKRADFRDPTPDSGEPHVVCEALRSALLTEIPRTKDALVRASQYHSLGLMCYKLESYDEGIEYFLKAVEHYNNCAAAEDMVTDGLQNCFVSILWLLQRMLVSGHDYGWILDKEGEEYPIWWISLHSVFGPVLQGFTSVIRELRSDKVDANQAKEAIPLCVEMLIIHLSFAILTWFEQQQDLDGILSVYEILASLYSRGVHKNDVPEERWPTVEQALDALGKRVHSWTDKDILSTQEELTSEDHAKNGEDPLKVQENLMDLYALKGEINKAMVCALVAVRMQEERWSPINNRARILQKAAMIARTARAEKDITAAWTIVESVETVLKNRNGRRWREDEIRIKKALLASLNDASLLLHSQDQELEKSATLLLCRTRKAIAKVHQGDSAVMAKWMIAAQTNEQAAESMNDDQGLNRYATTWLLGGTEEVDDSALNNALLLLLLGKIYERLAT
jgi:tetratricopeptide (TPR) repeat protein